jgi:AraC-like DNA-binding protein
VARTLKRYMDRHRIMRTHDIEAARAFLHGKGFALDVHGRDVRDFDLCINCAVLPSLSLGYLQNGIPTVTRTICGATEYQILLPVGEAMEARTAGECVLCGPERAVVTSPPRDYWARTRGCGARFRITITQQAVRDQLTALLGSAPAWSVEFAPSMDLGKGFGARFARHLAAAAHDFEHTNSIMGSPLTTTAFEQFIINELLLYHPHTYSEALQRLARSIASRDVKRAIDYIHASLEKPLTIADIAATAGVPGTTLFKHFRDGCGMSPMRYVRNQRLQRVHQELLNAQKGARVTEIASRWGFGHLGRFAIEYRLRFGESPSQTLSKNSGLR